MGIFIFFIISLFVLLITIKKKHPLMIATSLFIDSTAILRLLKIRMDAL